MVVTMMCQLLKLVIEDLSLVSLILVSLDLLLVTESLEFLKELLMVDYMSLILPRNSLDFLKIRILRKRLMMLRLTETESSDLILMSICRNLNLSHRNHIIDNSLVGTNVLRIIKLRLLKNLWRKSLRVLRKTSLSLRKVRRSINQNS